MVLGATSFCEAVFFPVPPDLLLLPMGLANRQKVFRFALICLLTSVAGGVVGYGIGHFFMEKMGWTIVHFYHLETQFATLQSWYQKYSVWAIALAGLTPLPYKLCTLSAGAFGLNLPLFVLVSLGSRGLRFYFVAALLYLYGEQARNFLERRFNLVLTGVLVLVVAGFFIMHYI
ncbi:MAG: cytochrome B [Proteobacteria bacterium]|nr:MAG: cytochrome B [Pseudomonadota bacterium]